MDTPRQSSVTSPELSNLENAKLTFCGNMTSLLEGLRLDTETDDAFIPWLRSMLKDKNARYFEFWQEVAEAIECMD